MALSGITTCCICGKKQSCLLPDFGEPICFICAKNLFKRIETHRKIEKARFDYFIGKEI